jgi:hypothetical protein
MTFNAKFGSTKKFIDIEYDSGDRGKCLRIPSGIVA